MPIVTTTGTVSIVEIQDSVQIILHHPTSLELDLYFDEADIANSDGLEASIAAGELTMLEPIRSATTVDKGVTGELVSAEGNGVDEVPIVVRRAGHEFMISAEWQPAGQFVVFQNLVDAPGGAEVPGGQDVYRFRILAGHPDNQIGEPVFEIGSQALEPVQFFYEAGIKEWRFTGGTDVLLDDHLRYTSTHAPGFIDPLFLADPEIEFGQGSGLGWYWTDGFFGLAPQMKLELGGANGVVQDFTQTGWRVSDGTGNSASVDMIAGNLAHLDGPSGVQIWNGSLSNFTGGATISGSTAEPLQVGFAISSGNLVGGVPSDYFALGGIAKDVASPDGNNLDLKGQWGVTLSGKGFFDEVSTTRDDSIARMTVKTLAQHVEAVAAENVFQQMTPTTSTAEGPAARTFSDNAGEIGLFRPVNAPDPALDPQFDGRRGETVVAAFLNVSLFNTSNALTVSLQIRKNGATVVSEQEFSFDPGDLAQISLEGTTTMNDTTDRLEVWIAAQEIGDQTFEKFEFGYRKVI